MCSPTEPIRSDVLGDLHDERSNFDRHCGWRSVVHAAIKRYPRCMTTPTFQINGRTVDLSDSHPTESLLRWLKARHLTGTKEGCGDGDCGACTVVVLDRDAEGKARYVSVNACLLPMGAMVGREVLTVEALATAGELHPVQQAMVDAGGSQCGYCTPGFVMSLFSAWYADLPLSDHDIEGNLCRCTGYRSIRTASDQLNSLPRGEDRFRARLREGMPRLPAAELHGYFSPLVIDDALVLKQQYASAQWIAGATDLGVLLGRGKGTDSTYIALDRIAELQRIERQDAYIMIGAGVTLARMEHELSDELPVLCDVMPWFAAKQVRQRATLGGNIGSASPIGDLLPLLLALDAEIVLRSLQGERLVPIAEYFTGYRQTRCRDDELIAAVLVPRDAPRQMRFYKIAKRQTDDISIVAACFALRLDAQARIRSARLAFGGVAATPIRLPVVEAAMLDRELSDQLVEEIARRIAASLCPLDDHRASADYRLTLCGNLWRRYVDDLRSAEVSA